MTIAIYLNDGFIRRVTTDDNAEHEVYVVSDEKPTQFLWSHHEVVSEITRHCAVARARSQMFCMGAAFELAADKLHHLSRLPLDECPNETLAKARDLMSDLADALRKSITLRGSVA